MNGRVDIDSLDKYVSLKFETENNIFDGYELILPVKDQVWKSHAFLGLMCELMGYEPQQRRGMFYRISKWWRKNES